MRRILSIAIALIASVSLFAQKDVTKFMGIPVDGFKPEMIQKLKEKGFVSSATDKDMLEGEFNGRQVYVSVGTNNNKVYRIALVDTDGENEIDIKIRFNRLCQQFENNSKYINISGDDYTIPDDEDISYGMMVENKRYEDSFYQIPDSDFGSVFDSSINKSVWFMIYKFQEEYYIAMYYDNKYNEANGEDL